ncbi:MAG TPA: SlyX family protein [Ectothiorhodospiraceae bacterium]|nr:SlyX family protein [Ectothiorhodospiraceae bacterium]
MESRVAELEFRLAHQELSIEELTQSNLDQQKQIDELKLQMRYLKSLISQAGQSAVGDESAEPLPPHY